MKKALKIFAVILTFAIAMCIGVFAAGCGEKEATEFTVKVVYADGKAVDGTKDGDPDRYDGQIKVQFCNADDANACWMTLPTLGADGTLKQQISEIKSSPIFANVENFAVHLLGLPAGYTYDENIVLNSKNASVTITLQAK